MSQEFMDPEIFADFILEAREHLETIEPNLLELENSPENFSLLNEIFRPMHSLKGASGFLGLNKINMLAHRSENFLDAVRKGEMPVSSEVMDVILSATDALRQMIDNLDVSGEEGDVEIDSIMEVLDTLLAGEPAPVPEVTTDVSDLELLAGEPKDDGFLRGGQEEMGRVFEEGTPYALTAFGEGHLRDFIEEAREMTEKLNDGLLELEKNPQAEGELVNDLFRYFHNLKGNSGILGFVELNSLTHEAETLLNNVRKGEMPSSHALVDLLLVVVDYIDALVARIDSAAGTVTPVDITSMLGRLQRAVAAGVVEPLVQQTAMHDEEQNSDLKDNSSSVIVVDAEDVKVFYDTVAQQFETIHITLDALKEDSSQKDYIDALFRSLVTIQNSSGYMELEDIKLYAERTAKLVDQARGSDLDFSLMTDILEQECAILKDMVDVQVARMMPEDEKPATDSAVSDPSNDVPASAENTAILEEVPAPASKTVAAPVENVAEPAVKAEQAVTPTTASAPAAKNATGPVENVAEPAAKPEQAATPTTASAPAAKSATAPVENVVKPAAKPEKAAAPKRGSAPAAKNATASTEKVAAKPAVNTPEQAGVQKGKASSTIRVDHEKLDHLMNLIGELIINRNRYTMLARRLEGENNVNVADVAQNLTETTYAMARISDDLQDTIMKVRMVPVSSVFSRFPRLVRDLSRKSGKEVELTMEGEETELDKSVVEVIGDPLVHLIRNAMDHGIESEEDRIAKGKRPKGRVCLRAYHKGNSVAIEIEDDGKGIDPEKMREVAVKKGIITTEEVKMLDDREAMELIFAPGFSSAETITDISGRGVGMDVVRTNIKNLKGSVSIQSELDKGTRFTLSLPLTLAIIDALMVKVAGDTYAIPLDAVSETTKIEAERLTDVNNRKAVTLRGEVLGIVTLSDLLGVQSTREEGEVLSVVVIHDNDRRLGVVVDRLLERQEIVIKPLGEYLGDLKGISGATIMGDGSVVLILDPHEVYLMATSKAM